MNVKVVCNDKQVNVVIPDHLTLEAKRKAFYLIGEALLREEVEAEMRAELAARGFDFDELRAQNKAMGLT